MSQQLLTPRVDLRSITAGDGFDARVAYLKRHYFAPPTPPSSAAGGASGAATSTTALIVAPSRSAVGSSEEEQQQQLRRPQPSPASEGALSVVFGSTAEELRKVAEEKTRSKQAVANRLQWKIDRISAGHTGRVTSISFDPDNMWFATGSSDTTVRAWDLVSGACKATLTGHKATVEAVAVSQLSPYLFSAGQDRVAKCWDLERNVVVRDFFGHLSAVHCVAAHPTQDLIVTGGRDSTVRVWDVRSPTAVHVMQGHSDTVLSVATQGTSPQIISGGADGMVYLWDITSGRPITRLTRHKKAVRSLCLHPTQNVLVSVGADDVRQWRLPTGEFMRNLLPEEDANQVPPRRWSAAALSPHGVLFVGAEGSEHVLQMDFASGMLIKRGRTKSLPGTIEGEGGVLAAAFDRSGTRLITAEGDKTVKFWSEARVASS